MFNRLRGKRGKDGATSTPAEDGNDQSRAASDAEGFLCPMCMEAMPGPAELQSHFEVAHSTTSSIPDSAKERAMSNSSHQMEHSDSPVLTPPALSPLIDLDPPADEGAIMNSSGNEADPEVSLLQQQLMDMAANLKEEKWYSSQLKKDHENIQTERDQLEEEKAMMEDEYRSKLASAESGFLQVVEENTKLKEELTYADYKSQKERHAKLATEIDNLKEKLESELIIKTSLQDALDVAEMPLIEKSQRIQQLEAQLENRPQGTDIDSLHKEIEELKNKMSKMESDSETEIADNKRQLGTTVSSLHNELSSYKLKMRELEVEKKSKEEQLESLQVALSSSSDNLKAWQQQQVEVQKEFISLQHNHAEVMASLKEKEALHSISVEQLNETKELLKNEGLSKQDLAKQLSEQTKHSEDQQRTITSKDNELIQSRKEIDGLKEELKRLESDRAELMQKIELGEGAETAMHHLQQEKENLVSGVADLQKEIAVQVQKYEIASEESRQKIQTLTDCLTASNEKCKHLNEIENGLRSNLSDLTAKHESSKVEIKTQSDALRDLEIKQTTENSVLQQEINDLKSVLVQKDTKITQIEEQVATSTAHLNSEISLKDNVEESLKKTMVELNDLSEKFKEKESERLSKEEELSRTQTEATSMTYNLNQQIEVLKSEIEIKSSFIKDIEIASTEKDNNINELKTQLSQKENEVTEQLKVLQSEIVELKMSLDESNQINSEQSETISDLNTKTQQLADEMNTKEASAKQVLDSTSESHTAEKQEFIIKIESLGKELKEINESYLKIKTQEETFQTKIEVLEKQNETRNTSLEQKDEVLRDIQAKLEVAEVELKKQCESCRNYEIQLVRLEQQHKDEFEIISNLKKDVEKKNIELENTNNSMIEEQTKLTTAQEEWEKEKNAIESSLEETSEVKAILEARVLELDDELKEAYNKFGLVTNEKEFLVTKLDSQEESKSLLLEELRFLETSNATLQDKINQSETQLTQQREERKSFETELSATIKDLNAAVESGKAMLEKEEESHAHTKSSFLTIQNALQEEMVSLQQKAKTDKEKHGEDMRIQDNTRQRLENQIITLKDVEKKCVERISNKDVTIKSLDNRIEMIEKDKDEIKGDIKVLEAQLQNSADEKRSVLDRLVKAEEQSKKSKDKLSETNRRLDQALAALQELGQENQNIQVKHNLKLSRQWEDDSKVMNCKKCDQAFTVTVRKHHCRHCGSIFCNECSTRTIPTPSSKKPVRVCDQCFNELGTFQQRRLSSSSMR